VIFGQYDFPGVEAVERSDASVFVERIIPGRNVAYRDVIGSAGRSWRVVGRVRTADKRGFMTALESLADGTARWFYDGSGPAVRAVMKKPSFRRNNEYDDVIEYEAEFAEQDNP